MFSSDARWLLRGLVVALFLSAVAIVSRALADAPAYQLVTGFTLNGDSSSANASYGGIAGTAQLPGGELHAFLDQNGQMTDLGTFGGTRSAAGFINASGQVGGIAYLTSGVVHAFEYQNGNMTDLGNFPGSQNYEIGISGMNSSGVAALDYFPTVSSGLGYFNHAAIWQNNQFTDLGTLGGRDSRALALNDGNEITGYSDTAAGVQQAFLWNNGTMTNLAAFPGVLATAIYSEGDGVSSAGAVAGTYNAASGAPTRGYTFANGQTTDIGTLGGNSTQVFSVAANGDVLGESLTNSGVWHAFVYRNGSMTDLGTLDGATASSFATREGTGGQLVGGSDTSVTGQGHAFISTGMSLVDLGTLGGNNATANAINSSGEVVGSSFLSDNTTQHAFKYANGVMTDLGTLGGSTSDAVGINDSGEIVGTSRTAGGQHRAFTFANGTLIQIPTLGGDVSQANAANAAGEVVGFSQTASGDQHAFVYQNGTVTDLNNLLGGQSSTAVAVNSSGQVAGTYQSSGADTSHEHAFLYSNGVITDLGTAGQTSSQATAINSKGDVAGFLKTPFGASQAFLYSNGTVTIIDTFDASSTVVAMNDNDQVLINAGTNAARLYSNGTLIDVTPLNALNVQPVAMNSSGAIVENATENFGGNAYYHAFIYQSGTFTDIGALINASSTFATDIDNAGDVLGHFTASNGLEQPFLFMDGTVYDLNNDVSGLPPGWSIESATFDGSASSILATAFEGQRTETFLLEVPEPASGGLALIVAVTLLTRRRVRRPL